MGGGLPPQENPTLEEQKEDDSTMTLQELEARRDELAEEVKRLSEVISTESQCVDNGADEEGYIEAVKRGDDEPFNVNHIGDYADALNGLPIVTRQWQNAVNGVIRRKAQMQGNGAPSEDEEAARQ